MNSQQKYSIVNPMALVNILGCNWRFEHAKYINMHVVPRKHVFRIFGEILKLLLIKKTEETTPYY